MLLNCLLSQGSCHRARGGATHVSSQTATRARMHTLARLDQFTDTLLFSLWQEVEVRGQRTSLCHSH